MILRIILFFLMIVAVGARADPLPVLIGINAEFGVVGSTSAQAIRLGAQIVVDDLAVIQTYSFIGADDPVAQRVVQAARRYGIDDPRRIQSPVGVAHAYDLVHILARAIQIANSTDRSAIRDALEQVTDYAGLVKTYPQPFTPDRHDALSLQEVFMARYAEDGAIVRIDPE